MNSDGACRKGIMAQGEKMLCVASIPLVSSAPLDSNDGNGVDMNTSALPNLVKPNVKSNVLMDISQ